jgi:hypothetical protein
MTLAKPTFGGRTHGQLGPGRPPYQAFTSLNVPIVSAGFYTRKQALWWAEKIGSGFPGSRIEQATRTGPRVIWREAGRERMAA